MPSVPVRSDARARRRALRRRASAATIVVVLASSAALLTSGHATPHAVRASVRSARRQARRVAPSPPPSSVVPSSAAPAPDVPASAPAPASALASPAPPPIATATVDEAARGVAVPPAFLGISMEYWGFAHDAGSLYRPDPLLARLLHGLASGGAPPTLRIGGRSADASWWNPARRRRPAGVSYDITRAWLRRLRAVAAASGVHVLLGLNLALGRPSVAVAWARAAAAGLLHGTLRGLEIGNEPDLYGRVGWYRPRGSAHAARRARSRHYDIARFTREFAGSANAVERAVPHVRIVGPGFSTPHWMGRFPAFLHASQRLLGAATYHRYPLRTCHAPRIRPTTANLLAPASGPGIAKAVAPYVAAARTRRLPFAITELNSVACGGRFGVSNTFASALWGLDTLLALAHAHVAGVAVHTRRYAAYSPFKLRRHDGRWIAHVLPLYDAMRLFADLTPAGTRVTPVAVVSRFRVDAWSLRDAGGMRHVVVIDKDPRARGTVRIAARTRGPAALVRLDAPSLGSTRPTLAGRRYGPDARLRGRRRSGRVAPAPGGYRVAFRRPGVAVLTIG